VTCPIIDGVVRVIAAVVSDIDGSVAADKHPELIMELKISVLTKRTCIFFIYIIHLRMAI